MLTLSSDPSPQPALMLAGPPLPRGADEGPKTQGYVVGALSYDLLPHRTCSLGYG